jgi:hypothetical protein
MKKWLIRYLVLNFLAFSLPGSYTVSMFKLGGLISHFHEHEQDGSEPGFFAYLTSHYFEKKHHEADHRNHEKLPFHDHHSENVNFVSQTPSLQPVDPSTFDASKLIIQSDLVITEIKICHASTYLGDIWQPPKA